MLLTKGEPMAFFDELAKKAILDGNTSTEFKRMAKKHANWTLALAILTSVIWYLSDRFWFLVFGGLTLFSATRYISAYMIKQRLEKHEKGHQDLY